MAVTQAFLGSYVMLLIDFREPISTWRMRWIVTVVLVVLANLTGLLFFNFWDTYLRVGAFTMTLPYILITFWCSKQRGFRAIFNIATALFIGCIGTANSFLAKLFLGENIFISFVARTLSFLLMFFLLRRFSSTYRQMLYQLNHGWPILCIIPIATFLVILYTINSILPVNPAAATIISYGLLAVCGSAYYFMYVFFEHVQKQAQANSQRDMLRLQVSALESRMDAVRTTENTLRTERHDLRHRLQTAAQLVAQGDRETALDFLNSAQKRLDHHREIHWCRPPVLDAVLSSYFEQAQQLGIPVEANLSLPDTLPVDEGELAIVFANALENAIHANQKLPPEKRKLCCKAMAFPALMLEVSNPCDGQISFDSQGLPIAQRTGHGLGVKSIAAFCQTHNAVFQFDQTEDNWFWFRLVF